MENKQRRNSGRGIDQSPLFRSRKRPIQPKKTTETKFPVQRRHERKRQSNRKHHIKIRTTSPIITKQHIRRNAEQILQETPKTGALHQNQNVLEY